MPRVPQRKKKPQRRGSFKGGGNHAPKFSWQTIPEGRIAKITALLICHSLGYDDDRMAGKDFPPTADLEARFNLVLPWFGDYYDGTREEMTGSGKYSGKMDEFSGSDLNDRIRYMFRDGDISTEHPLSEQQRKPGGLYETHLAHAEKLRKRIREGSIVSRGEARAWGTKRA